MTDPLPQAIEDRLRLIVREEVAAAVAAQARADRQGDRCFTVQRVASFLGCSRRKVWQLVGTEDLAPGEMIGKARCWTLEEVLECATRLRSQSRRRRL